MGSSCLLPYMCEDIEHMVCKKKCSHEVWCDCYIFHQDYRGCTTAKKEKRIVYPNLQSAMHPDEHSKDLPVPKPPDQEMWSSSSGDEHSSDETVELYDLESKSKPIPFSQETLMQRSLFNQRQK